MSNNDELLSENDTCIDYKVSVVIPLYNSSTHIIACVEYLKNQSYRNVEVIFVVDSKSDDDTLARVTESSKCLDNVTIIEQNDDKRSGGARNIGLDVSSGDYVWFLDVDDCPHIDYIKEMVDIIADNDCEVVVCNHYYSHEAKNIDPPDKEYKKVIMTGNEAMEKVCEGKIAIPSWNKIYNRLFLIINNIRFTSDYSEDYYYTMKSFMNANKVVYYNKPLYTYVLSDGTRSVGAGDKIVRADIRETMKVAGYFKEDEEKYNRFCAKAFRHLLRSMTNASSKTFRELSKTDDMKMLSKCKQDTFSLEVSIYRLSPFVYYIIGRIARKLKFSKKNLVFDRNI